MLKSLFKYIVILLNKNANILVLLLLVTPVVVNTTFCGSRDSANFIKPLRPQFVEAFFNSFTSITLLTT